MIDQYKLNVSGIDSVIEKLKTNLKLYKEKVNAIENLINEIDSSPAWKDEKVKTGFFSTSNSYIKKYNKLIEIFESYIVYLEGKKEALANLGNIFRG